MAERTEIRGNVRLRELENGIVQVYKKQGGAWRLAYQISPETLQAINDFRS